MLFKHLQVEQIQVDVMFVGQIARNMDYLQGNIIAIMVVVLVHHQALVQVVNKVLLVTQIIMQNFKNNKS